MSDMNTPGFGPVVRDTASIYADRVDQLYASLPLTFVAIAINGAILSAVMWNAAGHFNVSLWFGLQMALTLLRFGVYQAYRRRSDSGRDSNRWLSLFLAGVLGSGVLWGSSAWLLFPGNDPAHQLFVMFVLAGMAAGAITTLSASFVATLSFLLPALVPMIFTLFRADAPFSATMGLMLALFLVMIATSGWRNNRLTVESLRRRYEREAAEAAIEFQSCHDSLTELPNRRLLVDCLDQEISRCRRHHHLAAVLFIDIDRFKTINDSLSHTVGDALLHEVAVRLKRNLREEDTAARLGGDEFAVILSQLGNDEILAARKTRRLAEKIGNILAEPYEVNGQVLHVTASIGIAMCPLDGADADETLKQSDIAMYRAKQIGRGSIQFFLPDMQQTTQQRLTLENELRHALERDEMELYFQPQLDADGRVLGAEALLRWHHPERGMVSPAEFVPVAEETGIILPLGEWVLASACARLKAWMESEQAGGIAPFPYIAVNVSPRQFRQQDFFQRVQHIIRQAGVDPAYIELELTEGMLIENIDDTAYKMERLSDLGIRLSIDDFGTGYSSLSYLTRLHLDRIKIDQSFVRNAPGDASSATIVQTIIIMAQHLGLEVIAEGVETEAELAFLRDKGCLAYQGFYFSKPLPSEEFFRYLLSRR